MDWYPGYYIQLLLLKLIPDSPPKLPPSSGFPTPIPTPTPTPAPTPNPYEFNPQRDFPKPVLWKYYPNKNFQIWVPNNYKDYIIPNNEIVEYFIDRIKFEEKGHLLLIKYKSNNRMVSFDYADDDSKLCDAADQKNQTCYGNKDFWINPDYYIWNMFKGDCEDYALCLASVFERLGIPYMNVTGYLIGGYADQWIEFVYNDKLYLGQVNSAEGMPEEVNPNLRSVFKPYQMFNKNTDIQRYKEWYKELEKYNVNKAIMV